VAFLPIPFAGLPNALRYKIFQRTDYAQDDSCLNHLTNIPVGLTLKSSYIHNSEKSHTKNIMHFADATCIATPLCMLEQYL